MGAGLPATEVYNFTSLLDEQYNLYIYTVQVLLTLLST